MENETRIIEFRGREAVSGEWCYGDIVQWESGRKSILQRSPKDGDLSTVEKIPISPETVGQFTGFEDRNGRRIYEGDLLRGDTFYGLARVMWLASRGKLALRLEEGFSQDFWDFDGKTAEVVGNVHDNPGMARGLK